MDKRIVLKIGGSILYNANLDINFNVLSKVKDCYYRNIQSLEKLILVIGGGNLSREFQKKIGENIQEKEYLHNIAMSITQTNAALLQGYIADSKSYIPKKMGDAYEFITEDRNKTLISGGLKIGWSTDMDAAVFADMIGMKKVFKVSNVDYVYDSDPRINPNARAFKDLIWDEYFKLFGIVDGDGHEANKSMPIDVMCAQFCQKRGISFFLCGGNKLETVTTLEEIFNDGTLLH